MPLKALYGAEIFSTHVLNVFWVLLLRATKTAEYCTPVPPSPNPVNSPIFVIHSVILLSLYHPVVCIIKPNSKHLKKVLMMPDSRKVRVSQDSRE